MADEHDQAMEWAQANPTDPRSQDIMAKAWASKNPTDPRATQIMQKFQTPGFFDKLKSAATNSLPLVGGGLGGIAFGPLGAMAGAGVGSMAKNLVSGDQSSAPVALGKVGSDAIYQGLLPETAGMALSGVAGSVGKGLSKSADYIAQKAVGVRKQIPGMGNRFLDEGVWGTKDAMRSTVEDGLKSNGAKMQDLTRPVGDQPGLVDSKPIADKIREMSHEYRTSKGVSSQEAQPYLNKIEERAKDIESRGVITASEAQEFKSMAQNIAYNKGEPLQRFTSKVGQQEAFGYGDAIKQVSNDPAAYKQASDSYSTLKRAQGGLARPETTSRFGLTDYLAGGLGGAVGGVPGAVTGVVAKKVLSSPAVSSTAAKGANELSKVLTSSGVQQGLKQTPRTLQELLQLKDN
ncbi:MAG: hypothetical protein NVS1B10_03240 [Candidatus Saccharimonadales bacterium]